MDYSEQCIYSWGYGAANDCQIYLIDLFHRLRILRSLCVSLQNYKEQAMKLISEPLWKYT